MRTLGIIPARRGSKGIPGKNLRKVGGKSLIEWAVLSARGSNLTDFAVFTNDPEVMAEAERLECDYYVRPEDECTDDAKIQQTVKRIAREFRCHHAYCLLQPTNPLRSSQDIDECLQEMERTKCDNVLTVSDATGYSPTMGFFWHKDVPITPVFPSMMWTRRQDLPMYLIRDGGVYLASRASAISGHLWSPGAKYVCIDRRRSVRIDCEDDLLLAEFRLTSQNRQPKLPTSGDPARRGRRGGRKKR